MRWLVCRFLVKVDVGGGSRYRARRLLILNFDILVNRPLSGIQYTTSAQVEVIDVLIIVVGQ